MPKGIYSTYDQILARVPDENVRSIHNILMWLVCSERPLHLSELAETMIFDVSSHHYYRLDPENLPWDSRDALAHILSLVIVDQDGIVQLMHASLRDYLLSEASHRFQIRIHDAHRRIALSCIAYILGHHNAPSKTAVRALAQRAQKLPFRHIHSPYQLEVPSAVAIRAHNQWAKSGAWSGPPLWIYASLHLGVHLRRANLGVSDVAVQGLLKDMSSHTHGRLCTWLPLWASWTGVMFDRDIESLGYPSLWIASYLGHAQVISFLREQGADECTHIGRLATVSGQPYMETSLVAVVRGGHLDSVTPLVKHGADPNGMDHRRSSCQESDVGMARALVNHHCMPHKVGDRGHLVTIIFLSKLNPDIKHSGALGEGAMR
jgi:hypothetical protein